MFENSLVGDKKVVNEKIKDLNNNISNEITVLTWCFDENERINSYKLFSETYN